MITQNWFHPKIIHRLGFKIPENQIWWYFAKITMPRIKLFLHLNQWHLKGIINTHPTKLDSIQLSLWITRY
jgi:hypothetical protein